MKINRFKQAAILILLGAFFAITRLLTHAGVEFVASGSNSITGHTSLADARFSLSGTVLTVDIYNTSTNASTDPTEVLTGILFNNAPSNGPIVSTSSECILAGGKIFPSATSVISYATKTPLSSIACLVANPNGGLWDFQSSSQNSAIPAPFNGGFACVNYGFKNNGKNGLVSSNFVGNLNNIKYTVMAPPMELVVSNYTGTLPTTLAFCYGTSTSDPILVGVNVSQAPVKVGDYVWVDANGNGIQDSGETGLAGVSVVLYRTNSGLGTLTALATNTTSATGAYLFTNQSPGSFVVGFGAASGYSRTAPYQGSNSNLDSNAQVGSGLSEAFTLTSGQTNLTVDAGYYQPANLSGTVVLDVNGNAVQDAGDTNGLSGVLITLKTNGVAMLAATTGSTGAYSFTNLPPGSYTVVQTMPAGYTNTTALSLPVTLVSGQSSPGNKFLDTQPVTIGDYVWVDANGNGIQDNGETGLAGVSVILYRTNSGLGTLTTVATTTTSVSGAYLFTNQLPNSFVVGFGAASGYTRTAVYQGSNSNLDCNAQVGSGLSEVFTLTSGQTNLTVDAGYYQLGNLSGTVVLDVNGNAVQDAGETNGLSGVLITLKTNGVTMLTTTTGSTGTYSFTNLPPGSYTVVQTVPAGYANTTTLSLPVTLVSGQSSPGNKFLDTKPVTIGDYAWVDADGDGIQDNGEIGLGGVQVILYQTNSGSGTLTALATNTTSVTGAYLFTNQLPKSFVVGFGAVSGYTRTSPYQGTNSTLDSNAQVGSGLSEVCTLTSGQTNLTVDAGYYQPANLSGTVVLDLNANGVPDAGETTGLSGVLISLKTNGVAMLTTTTDSSGNYSFANLPPGSYTVVQTLPGGYTNTTALSLPVTLVSGQSSTGNKFLDAKPVTIGDYVWVDADGDGIQDNGETGLAGVSVILYRTNSGLGTLTALATNTTSVSGAYLFTNQLPNSFVVGFGAVSGYTRTSPYQGTNSTLDCNAQLGSGLSEVFTLTSGQTNLTVDAGYYQLSNVSGTVVLDVNGNGVQDAGETNGLTGVLITLKTNGVTMLTTTTGSTGAYSFANLPPGSYTVVQTLPAGYANTTTVSLPVTLVSGQSSLRNNFLDTKPVTIGDYAWVDADGDGLQDNGEIGLVGVQVILYQTNSGLGTLTALATNTTSVTGAYLFTNQLPNSFVVGFGAVSGYTRTSPYQGTNSILDSNAQLGSGLSEVFTLTSGQTNLTVDAGYFQLANVSGTVVLDANANGVQDVGETTGLTGVSVALKANGVTLQTTTTDSSGNYSFANLAPGSYTVLQMVPGGYTNTTALSLPVTLVSGQSSPGHNYLDTQSGSIGNYVWMDADRDGIQDNGEIGLAGVSVVLYRTNSGLGTLTALATNTTSASGAYLFTNQFPGSFVVGFGLPAGYAYTIPNVGTNNNVNSDAGSKGLTPVFALASGQAITNIDAGYVPLFSIGNRVFVDNGAGGGVFNNGLMDGAESGISNIVLKLYAAGTNGLPVGSALGTKTTDVNGFYRFDQVTAGTYFVVLDAMGSGSAMNGFITSTGASTNTTISGDKYDHGNDAALPWGAVVPAGLVSAPVTVGLNLQPIGETTGAGQGTNGPGGDASDNLTVDFGLVPVGSLCFDFGTSGATSPGQATGTNTLVQTLGATYGSYRVQIAGYDNSGASPVLKNLYRKNAGGDETGVGFPDTLDNELALTSNGGKPANFVQIDVSQVYQRFSAAAFQCGSVTLTESVDIYGSSTKGTIGTLLLSGSVLEYPNYFTAPAWGSYPYYTITVHPNTNSPVDNILFNELCLTGERPSFSLGNRVFSDNGAGGGVANDGVLNGSESGLANVVLKLFAADANGNPTGVALATNLTDASGWYRFDGLAAGTYVVVVDVTASGNVLTGFISSSGASTNTTLVGDVHDHGKDVPVTVGGVTNGIASVPVTLGVGLQPTGETTGTGQGANGLGGDANDNLVMDFGFVPACTIGDYVWVDANGNGIQDNGEIGLAGVQVVLYQTNSGLGTLTALATNTTSASGAYLFTNQLLNSFVVGFGAASGYTRTLPYQGSNSNLDSNAQVGSGLSEVFSLTSGQTNLTVDAGYYQPANLSGTVVLDVNANGVQDTGETIGLSGVSIALQANGVTLQTTTTDSSGAYSFANLAPGSYTVVQTVPAGYMNTTALSLPVTLVSGQSSPGHNYLDTQPVTIGDYAWVDANGNGIQDNGEIGLTGVQVILYQTNSGLGTLTALATNTTSASGAYLFANQLPNSFVVGFGAASGYTRTAANQGSNSNLDSDGQTSNGLSQSFTLTSGQTNLTVDAGYYQLANVSGTVVLDVNANGVQDAGETNSLSGVLITLKTNGVTMLTTNTDSNGNYSFTNLRPGSFTVVQTVPAGYTNTTALSLPVTLVSGQSSPGHNYLDTQPVTIGDYVWVDANGNGLQDNGEIGLAGVSVVLYQTNNGAGTLTALATNTTSFTGAYLFANQLPNSFVVGFGAASGYTRTAAYQGSNRNLDSNAQIGSGLSEAFTLTSGLTNLTVDAGYYQPANLSGTVVLDVNANGGRDAGETTALTGVSVVLKTNGVTMLTTTTDSSGNYSFTNLAPGSYTVVQTVPAGYTNTTTLSLPVTLVSGQSSPGHNYLDTQPVTIGDYVWVDANGNGLQDNGEIGLAGVSVILYQTNSGLGTLTALATNISAVTGAYSFANVLPSTNSFLVSFSLPAGYYFAPQTAGSNANVDSNSATNNGLTALFALTSGQTNNTVDAGYVPLATIGNFVFLDVNNSGIFVNGTDSGINGVSVQLWNANGLVAVTNTATLGGVAGSYSFNVPAGAYYVKIPNPPASSPLNTTVTPGGDNNDNGYQPGGAGTAVTNAFITLSPGQVNNAQDVGFVPVSSLVALGNRVFLDVNGDGIFNGTDTGAPAVAVQLYTNGQSAEVSTPLATVTTDSTGYYYFDNLLPGGYFVHIPSREFQPGGHLVGALAETITGVGDNQNHGLYAAAPASTGINSGPVVLAVGNQPVGEGTTNYTGQVADANNNFQVDLAVVPNSSQILIGDTVFLDSNNNGVQDAGETGINGVGVQLWQILGGVTNLVGTQVTATLAGNAGRYQFSEPPGTYLVKIAATNFLAGGALSDTPFVSSVANLRASGNVGVQPGGMGSEAIAATAITLAAGQNNFAQDFGFTAPVAIGDYAWVDANGNGLQDNGEIGLGGVQVILYQTNNGAGTLTALATNTTSVAGAYLFTNQLPNNFVVGFGAASGYTRTAAYQGSNSNLDSNAQVGSGLSEAFTLTSGQTNLTLDVGYYQLANVSGTVLVDVNANGVQDAGETTGLAGVSIALQANGVTLQTTTTDSSGNYSFANLAPGTYTVVQAVPGGYTNTTALSLPVTLVSGQSSPGHNYLDTQPVTIGDYVWVDADGDGLQDNGEIGLAGVSVVLYRTNSGLGTLTALATNTTSFAGAYLFTNQLPNSFVVGFGAASGYTRTAAYQGSNSNLDSNAQVGSGLSEAFTLTSGQTNLTVDAGYYQLANVSGTVVLDANGNGVQDAGETTGLTGVSVALQASGVTVLTTTTDSSGNYSFANLAPGSYTVVQTVPAGYTNTTALTLPVTLVSGQSSPGHNYLDTQPVTIGDYVWVDANGNGLQDNGEIGLGGVPVILYQTNNGAGTLTALATNTTSVAGAYLFTNQLPNNFVVGFGAASSYTRTAAYQGSNSNLDSNAQVGSGLSEAFTLTSGQTNLTVDAGYYQPANLSGTVVLDVNANGVQDAGETTGLTGVSVALQANGVTVLTTTTDSSGNYSFANLAPGNYTVVQAVPGGYTNTTALSLPVTLVSGQSSPGHNYLDTQPVTIGDYVWVDANGNGLQDNGEIGLAGVQVILYQTNSGLGTLTALATNTTSFAGAYLFTNQLPNSFVVGFGAASGYTRTAAYQGSNSNLDSNAQLGSGLSKLFTLTSGQANLTVDAGYYQLANVSGTVVLDINANGVQDAGERTGLSGVSIALQANGVTLQTTTTDSSGAYSFANLAPGSYTVVQTVPAGYTNTTALSLPVTLVSGQSSTNNNYLDTQPVTIGDYAWVDANGNGMQDNGEIGLGGVPVILYQTNNGAGTLTALATNTTSASGAYLFTNQLPNSFVVGFGAASGYTRTAANQGSNSNLDSDAQTSTGLSQSFTLTSGQANLTVDAGYYQLANVSGTVVLDVNANSVQDAGETTGLTGVSVALQANGVTLQTTTTDSSGNYSFASLAPGNYTVVQTVPAGYTNTTTLNLPVTLVSGQSSPSHNYLDTQPVTIGDYVWVDANGNGMQDNGEIGLGGVPVILYQTNSGLGTLTALATNTTSASGAYLFTNQLPNGFVVGFGVASGYTRTAAYQGSNSNLDSDAQTSTGLSQSFTLTSGQANLTVDAGYYQLANVSGTVVLDANANSVQDAGETTGLTGVSVALQANGVTLQTTTTDSSGAYSFANLAPGNYTVVQTVPGGYTNTTTLNLPVTLVSGQSSPGHNYLDTQPVTIGDYVWVDANGNGLQDNGEIGLGGVPVILYQTNNGAGTLTALATNTTSASGAYLFTNQLPNSFVVGFGAASGYTRTAAYQGSNSNLDSDAQTSTGLSQSFTLTSGQANLTVDAGYYQLANVSGTVVLDANANSVQDAGETTGLIGVSVALQANGVTLQTTTTDSSGAYSFANLAPGSYTVVQTVPAGYTNTTTLNLPVTLVSGQSSPGHNYLDTQPVTIGDYVWVDANGNGLQDNGEIGLGGVPVILYQTNNGAGTLTALATNTTSVTGAYLFTNQLPNSFVVGFGGASGYTRTAPYQGSNSNLDSDAQTSTGLSQSFTLTSGQANLTVDAGYYQLANVSGTVVLDVNANSVQDAGETTGLTGVSVALQASGVTVLTTTTDSSGNYSFANLAPGSYMVVQTVPAGYTNTTTLNLPVTLVSGQSSPGHNYLDTQPVTIGDYVWVDANGNGIQDADEAGLLGVSVILYQTNSGLGTLTALATTTTSASGAYLFSNQLPGSFVVGFGDSVGYTRTIPYQGADRNMDSDAQVTTGLSQPFTLTSGQTNLTVDTGYYQLANLSGTVVLDANGNGVQDAGETVILPGVLISLQANGVAQQTTTTDSSGNYSFANLPPGSYTVVQTLPAGYTNTTALSLPVTLISGQSSLENNYLDTQPVTIGDYVWLDANGNGIQDNGEVGLSGVTVVLYQTNSDTGTLTALATNTTSASGAYLFTNQLPGSFVVGFSQMAGYVATSPYSGTDTNLDSNAQVGSGLSEVFTLTSGQTNLTVDAGYYQPASLSGTVVVDANANGVQDSGETATLADVLIALQVNGVTLQTTTTDGSGNYSFANLAPGSYTVVQTVPGGYTNTTTLILPVTLVSGQSSPGHNYLDTQPVTIGDYVWVDANGNGLQDNGEIGLGGVPVILYQTNNGAGTLTALATNTTSASGAYLFANQLPNSFVVGFGAASGYTRTLPYQGGDSNLDSDALVSTGLSQPFTLTSGQANLTVDAGYCQPASLSGSVVLDVNGNGLRDAGDTTGLSGVLITLKTNGVTMLTTNTDSNGNYSFANLPSGNYTVLQVVPVGYRNTTPLALPVTLSGGQNSTGNNYLDTQPVTIGDYVWVDGNANGVQDNGEAGLAGVSVVLYQTNSGLGTLTALATNTTSASGGYLFTNQLPNKFVVGFTLPSGYALTLPYQGSNSNLDSNAQIGTGLSELFNLTSGQTNLTVDAGCYQPVTIGDYAWLDINGNGIQDGGEPPMAGVAIVLFQSNLVTHVVSTVASTTSAGDGTYSFANLPPGTYQLSFNPPGGGYTHSPALQGSNTNVDSDANATSGLTTFFTMASGTTNLTLDAGFKPNPTAVSLVSLSAVQDQGNVWVTWQTYVEDGVLAFDLTRSTDGGDEQEVTPDLVWATGLDMGQTYRVQDLGVPAGASTYHLYAYNNDGSVDEVATVNIAVANTVVATPVQMLGLQINGTSGVLRWMGGQPPYVVEQSGSLGADANWQPVGGAQTGTQMTVPLTGPAGFFRVRSGGN